MATAGSAPSLLLALPDSCLLAVLQCLAADDQCSLFSAARAHSRLHQAAVVALRSITLEVTNQRQLDDVLLYLAKHGQHVDSMDLSSPYLDPPQNMTWHPDAVALRELPCNLQLSSLLLHNFLVQLQPGGGFQGLLGAAAEVAALKELELSWCDLLDDAPGDALAATLSQLPAGLEHLSLCSMVQYNIWVPFTTDFLQRLQHLTHLGLWCSEVQGADQGQSALQPLQALTRLQDLRLSPYEHDGSPTVLASMLSGMHSLTHLQTSGVNADEGLLVEPEVLAGKTLLQHLQVGWCTIKGGAAGAAQLLSYLQPLQQLTHLDMGLSKWEGSPPAAAFSALTASSKLRHLDLHGCTLPAGVWQHVFPAGRQLPHLRSLKLNWVKAPDGSPSPAPEGRRLVSCCPGLQYLDVGSLQYSAELLAALQELSGLRTLCWRASSISNTVGTLLTMPLEDLPMLCQLTGLVQLSLVLPEGATTELLQLSKLQELTSLECQGVPDDPREGFKFTEEDPDAEPVWRQLLWHFEQLDPCELESYY